MKFSFIHTADIHLDSPLTGLEQYVGAPVEKLRGATRDAFKNLVEKAIELKVAFVIIAGDLYDGDWKDYNTGLFFVSQMVKLQKKNIKVYLVKGNHDAASSITKGLKLPDNVIEFSVRKPETCLFEELKVAIHGQGFSTKAVIDNLVENYPHKKSGYFNIGIIHTSANGREGYDTYAPCSLNDMISKNYDYWALGHIHLREILHEKNPTILYPGNIQGRHIKETGNKGCSLITVEDGVIEAVEHIDLDILRWEEVNVDISNLETEDELLDLVNNSLLEQIRVADGKFLAVRINLIGATKLHQELIVKKEILTNNIRSLAIDVGQGDIWIEKIKFKTSRLIDLTELKARHTPIAIILDYIDSIADDEMVLEELLSKFNDIKQKLPIELKTSEEDFNFNNTDLIKNRIKDVEDLILYSLQKEVE